jgi:hypothetical protein
MGYVVLLAQAVVSHEDARWDPLTLFYSDDAHAATRKQWEALVSDELRGVLDIISKPLCSKPPRSMMDSDSDDFSYPSNFMRVAQDLETDAAAYTGYLNNPVTPDFPEFGEDPNSEVHAMDADNVAPSYGVQGPFSAEINYDTGIPTFPVLDAWRIDEGPNMDTDSDDEGPAVGGAPADVVMGGGSSSDDVATESDSDEGEQDKPKPQSGVDDERASNSSDSEGEDAGEVRAGKGRGGVVKIGGARSCPILFMCRQDLLLTSLPPDTLRHRQALSPAKLTHTPVRRAEEVALSPRSVQAVRDMPTDPFVESSSPISAPNMVRQEAAVICKMEDC